MDFEAGWDGISRDVGELLSEPVLAVVFVLMLALPVASAVLVAARRWLALAPLAIGGGLFAEWFLYYATDWWSNPGQGAWLPAFLLVLVGWVLVGVAARRPR